MTPTAVPRATWLRSSATTYSRRTSIGEQAGIRSAVCIECTVLMDLFPGTLIVTLECRSR
jgi:hypothetical protein